MAVVASATGVALGMTAGTVGAGLVGGAVLGAGAGALYSGITGDGDILNSALTGAVIGGGIGGLGAAFAAPAAGMESAAVGALGGPMGTFTPAAGYSATLPSATTLAANAPTAATASSVLNAGNAVLPGELGNIAVNSSGQLLNSSGAVLNPTIAQGAAEVTPWAAEVAKTQASTLTPANAINQVVGPGSAAKTGTTGMEMLGYGLAGTTALSLLGGMNQKKLSNTTGTTPSYIRPYTYKVSQNQSAYPTGPQYGSNGLPIIPTSEKSYFNQSFTAGTPYQAAEGGLMSVPPVPSMMKSGPADVNFMGNDMYPTSQQHRAYYATPTQMPTSAQQVAASYEPNTNPLTGKAVTNMAAGGQVNLQGTFTAGDGSSGSNPFESNQQSQGLAGGFGGFGPEARAFQQSNLQSSPEAQQGQAAAMAGFLRDMNRQRLESYQNSGQSQGQSNWGGPNAQTATSTLTGPDTTQFQMGGGSGISFADGGIARFKSGGDDNFDAANYNASLSLADMKKIRKRAIMNRQDMEDEARKEIMLDLIAAPLAPKTMPGANVGSDNAFEKYMMTSQTPTGAFGRVGASKELDSGAKIRAGASGTAMAIPGKHGITAMPQALDIGYTSARKSEEDPYYDLSAFRSIDPIPGRGHAQGINARYTMPFADGGITYDAATQTYQGLPSIGGPVADVPVLDAAPAAQANPDMPEFSQGEFAPATALYKNELGDLTSQWQSANPYAKTYNAANQTYGAGQPTNAQLLALKNSQAQQAFNDRMLAMQQNNTSIGGGANGGLMPYNLGSYSDGGRLLKGPGDGVSDDIPAVIGHKQPARLADGEFVIPARIVSEIGNGSTDAGAKRLYAMMDKIQAGRKKTIGKGNVAKDTKAKKHLLA